MEFALGDMEPLQRYHLLAQTIVPRPIAWILTRNQNATWNIAPFSFFNVLSSVPPLIITSIGSHDKTRRKDTRVNIEREKKYVCHIAHADLAEEVTKTSLPLDYGESEVSAAGLEVVDFVDDLVRIKQAKIAIKIHSSS